jgi:tetratricopeptide (TPR) repeat protein
LETAVSRDSFLVDAYTGIGTYYYWKTRKIEFLTWLPFVADRREQGIALLQQCARGGAYNRFAAMSALVTIYLDAARYDKAAETARSALAVYPKNRIFLWGLATSLERGGNAKEAADAYARLLQSILDDTRPNIYNELVCRLNLLTLRIRLNAEGDRGRELSRIRELAARQFPKHLEERVEDKQEKIKALESMLAREGLQ